MKREPHIKDVLEAIQIFSHEMDKRFDTMDQRFDRLEGRVGKIETTMVTKEYLDEKLTDLRGDLVVLVRKEDRKFGALVDELIKRKVLDYHTGQKILAMEPFAQAMN